MICDLVTAVKLVSVNCVHRNLKVVDGVIGVRGESPPQVVRLVDLILIEREGILHGDVLDVAGLEGLSLSSPVEIVSFPNKPLQERNLLELANLDVKNVFDLVVRFLFVTFALAVFITRARGEVLIRITIVKIVVVAFLAKRHWVRLFSISLIVQISRQM